MDGFPYDCICISFWPEYLIVDDSYFTFSVKQQEYNPNHSSLWRLQSNRHGDSFSSYSNEAAFLKLDKPDGFYTTQPFPLKKVESLVDVHTWLSWVPFHCDYDFTNIDFSLARSSTSNNISDCECNFFRKSFILIKKNKKRYTSSHNSDESAPFHTESNKEACVDTFDRHLIYGNISSC